MISKTIRKNISTNNWEHFVQYKNGFVEHWSPGIISNDDIYNDTRPLKDNIRNSNDFIISYEDWNYKDIEYSLLKINTNLSDKSFKEF